jgi:hypothetical protein
MTKVGFVEKGREKMDWNNILNWKLLVGSHEFPGPNEKRWWPREDERPFPDWQTEGVDVKKPRAPKPTRQFTVTAPSPGTPYRESNT